MKKKTIKFWLPLLLALPLHMVAIYLLLQYSAFNWVGLPFRMQVYDLAKWLTLTHCIFGFIPTLEVIVAANVLLAVKRLHIWQMVSIIVFNFLCYTIY